MADIAGRLVQARLSAAALRAFPGVLPADLSTAYLCQEMTLSAWPDSVAGWKVARIGWEWRSQFPEERLIGPILRRNLRHDVPGRATLCPVFEAGFAAVEAEIGIFVQSDAPEDRTDWTRDSAARLIAQICAGIEVASSPLATVNDLGPAAVISDFGNNWGAIAGPTLRWREQADALRVVTRVADRVVGDAEIDLRGAPLDAFVFALNKAARLGRPLRAGQYISTGMITGVHDVRIGDDARVSFGDNGDAGEIRCRFVRAEAVVSEPSKP